MRTQRELYTEKTILYDFELEKCPQCGQRLTTAYTSGWKTVQTMSGVITIAQRPKRCMNMKCAESEGLLKSALWQQIAPMWCTYGYDVIAQIGWQRQIRVVYPNPAKPEPNREKGRWEVAPQDMVKGALHKSKT